MKSGSIFFSVFVFAVLVLGAFQILNIYSPNLAFESEVSEHMKSSFLIKESFLENYFLENKQNVLALSSSNEVQEIFTSENIFGYNKEYIERFVYLFNYSALYLIDSEGNFLYDFGSGADESNLPLSNIMSENAGNNVFSYGPYRKIGVKGLYVSFVSNNNFGELVILEKSMNKINEIVSMDSKLSGSEEFYLSNKAHNLITPINNKSNPLIQSVSSDGLKECFFNKKVASPSFFINYAGEDVYGVYKGVSEFEWCLAVEVSRKEVIEDPIKVDLISNLIFVFSNLIILILILFFIRIQLNKKYTIKILNRKRLNLFLALVFAGLSFGAISFASTIMTHVSGIKISLPILGNIIFSLVVFACVCILMRRKFK